jgi:uncharacterized BrkB/YihY/UPF0761 family membrane protein
LIAVLLGIMVLAEIAVVIVTKSGWDNHSVRVVGLTLVAFLAVFAYLTADPNTKDVLPAVFGLLGSIAGFIVGKTGKSD